MLDNHQISVNNDPSDNYSIFIDGNSVQFSFIYKAPNKCHLRAIQRYSPIQANQSPYHFNTIIIQSNPIN